ncbi:hypothetical protein QTP70_012653 [Hemibagrus guttatus]|uniref:Tc1-like transposase DDE domain-containing protein n=1 Tax=Hemibagrus guttatus TaxID=175788 RepID=A0AAE0RAY6_9TELE|nr:hypothetical protein QTP70_012653 [Hemibagrus guttatus]
MLYGLETVSLRKKQEAELEVAELKMLRFSLGVTRLDRIKNEYIRGTAHVGCLGDKVREARLRWFGHVQRRERVVLGPLVPVKGTLNASAYQDILENFMLPTLSEQFGNDPFLFQHDCTPVHKARSIKTWMSEFGVEDLDRPAQSPDLNLIEHLWDKLERRLRARPSRPTSVSDLTNVLLEEW